MIILAIVFCMRFGSGFGRQICIPFIESWFDYSRRLVKNNNLQPSEVRFHLNRILASNLHSCWVQLSRMNGFILRISHKPLRTQFEYTIEHWLSLRVNIPLYTIIALDEPLKCDRCVAFKVKFILYSVEPWSIIWRSIGVEVHCLILWFFLGLFSAVA